jgi:uncharacterized protein YndB with AHSA1/START domain
MTRIREEITIRAPAAAVWKAVHTDLENVPRWAGYLRRAESVQGRPGPNWRVRYDLELPGGFAASLTMQHTDWEPYRRCAGRFVEGPLQGDWSYTYEERQGATHLVYEMNYQLGGLLRFAGGMMRSQYADGIRQGMAALKQYVESAQGGREAKG